MKFSELVKNSRLNESIYGGKEPEELTSKDYDKVNKVIRNLSINADPDCFEGQTAWESEGNYYIYFSYDDGPSFGLYELVYDGSSVVLNISDEDAPLSSGYKPGRKLKQIVQQKQNVFINLFKQIF